MKDIEIYDIIDNVWMRLEVQLPVPICWPGVCALNDNIILITGGWVGNSRSPDA